MKKSFFILMFFLFASGCASVNKPQVFDTNQYEGVDKENAIVSEEDKNLDNTEEKALKYSFSFKFEAGNNNEKECVMGVDKEKGPYLVCYKKSEIQEKR